MNLRLQSSYVNCKLGNMPEAGKLEGSGIPVWAWLNSTAQNTTLTPLLSFFPSLPAFISSFPFLSFIEESNGL